MRSVPCVTMLAVCLFALQCTAANDVLEGQKGDQRSGVPSTDAVTTTTKQPQAAPNSQTVTVPEGPQSELDSAGLDGLNAPSDAARSADPLITTTTNAQTSLHSLSQKSSTDLKDKLQSPPQQPNTGQGLGVPPQEDHQVIPPKVHNSPNQDATQSQPDVTTPLVPAPLKPQPALPSPGQSKKQQPQTPQTNTSSSGGQPQGEIGNASQPGQIAIPTTTTSAATEKRNEDSKEATTTTVAPTLAQSIVPTTTSDKRSTLPQSVDKKDGSSSNSLVFAFATLVTLAVIPVAPAF